jgi:hypothetical protein
MPIYDFKCNACDDVVEMIQSPDVHDVTEPHDANGEPCEGAYVRVWSFTPLRRSQEMPPGAR